MSQPCAVISCKRTSRALCHCCQQNVCIPHLNEHSDQLNAQLGPLADQINVLGERLKTFNIEDIISDCRQKLEQWRKDSYKKIDYYFEQKCQELDRLVLDKLNKQREDTTQIRAKAAELIRDQEATRQDIDTLTSTIRRLKKEMNEIEQERFRVNACPLLIDDCTVQFQKVCEYPFDLSNLSPAYKTIKYPNNSCYSLVNNDRLLLTHQAPNLCFLDTELRVVKQILWSYDMIGKICWSSTLAKFIILTNEDIFLVDENMMTIDKASLPIKQRWLSCTCFNDQLFLSTDAWGSSIVETVILPSITVTREWKCPTTCTTDELIHDIDYSNGTLAAVIENKVRKSMRIELRSSKTLVRLWSLLLDDVYNKDMTFRCCSIDYHGWLVADLSTGRLLHVTTDGKMKQTIPYKAIPYRVNLFGSKILVVSTKSGINFHKI